jgi:hypothetical protein
VAHQAASRSKCAVEKDILHKQTPQEQDKEELKHPWLNHTTRVAYANINEQVSAKQQYKHIVAIQKIKSSSHTRES